MEIEKKWVGTPSPNPPNKPILCLQISLGINKHTIKIYWVLMHINSFDIGIAGEYGVDSAIIIHKFQQWIKANKIAGRHQINGRTWLKQSHGEIVKSFPYWDFINVDRLITQLKKQRILEMQPHGLGFFDYTPYYSFMDEDRFVVNFSNYGKEVIEIREERKELPVEVTFKMGLELVEDENVVFFDPLLESWKNVLPSDCFQILSILNQKNKITSISSLINKTKLSHDLVKEYLQCLENKNILKIQNKGQTPIKYELNLSRKEGNNE